MEYTQNEMLRQIFDEHWQEFCDYWAAKTRDASQIETVSFDQERHTGVLMRLEWQGLKKIVVVTPQDLLSGLAQLNEELRQRCIEGAQTAENAAEYANDQGDYAKGQGDRIGALIEEITTLKDIVEQQGNTAEEQGAAAQAIKEQIEEWYSPFKSGAETWYDGIVAAWNSWFSETKAAWTEWFNARKAEWNLWFQGVMDDWSTWFTTTDESKDQLFANIRDTWDDMSMMFSWPVWNPQTTYLRNKAVKDAQGNWWVSLKSSVEEPNINHPLPGFDDNGEPVASEWWRLWIDWQHPMAQLLAAISQAVESAENADAKAERAENAAIRAEEVDVIEQENRILALEETVGGITDEDLVQIREAISSLQSLIGADVDGNINKFNEIVAFLSGVEDTETLAGMLQDIATQLAGKQAAGDYATNDRVDEIETKMMKYAVPRFEGDSLVFPAENGAHFEDDELILTV